MLVQKFWRPRGNRNLLAKSDVPIDFKTELFREKFGHEFGDSVFECRLIGIVTLHVTIIGAPTHPLRFRWQIPFVRIEIPNQPRSDFCLTQMGSIVGIGELGGVSDPPWSPFLPATKPICARRQPNHRAIAVHHGTDEIPLMSPEVTWSWNKNDPLVQTLRFECEANPRSCPPYSP